MGETRPVRILVVDDEAPHTRALCDTLRAQGFDAVGFTGAEAALVALREAPFELLLTDLNLPGTDGIHLVEAARAVDPYLACVIMTGDGSIASAVAAMKVGALDYVLKPCKLSVILPVLSRAMETRQLRLDNAALEARAREHAALMFDLNRELEQARREADHSNALKSKFLATMSHELRTPLNAILGFAQILNSDVMPSTPAQKKVFAKHILQAGKHLLVLINEVLDLAKVESGKLTVSIEPVGLAQVFQECQSMMAALADKRGITLHFAHTGNEHVFCDRLRIKQALINLITNAIKYNREHGTVTVFCEPGEKGWIRIGVRDTGTGLDLLQQAQLFQPFNRLDREVGVEEGTGIGLALTRHLVELMGGTIEVDSTVDVGSTFWINFVLCEQAALPRASDGASSAPAPVLRPSRTRHLLLYIEDNPTNLQLVEEIIAPRTDLRLISAQDGQEGIALARQCLPHVILVDINLPGMDGYEVRRILQADPRTAQIPVIAVTASAMPSEVKRGMDAGFRCYITKPIDIDLFTAAIDKALQL